MSYAGDSLDGVKKLLIAAAATADAKSSMRERINSYLAQIKKLHKYETCHFCNKRERNPKYPMVLRGKKETGRDYGFNSTTIYYSIKPAIIPRCDNCADFHQFIHEVSIWFSVASFFCLIFSFFGLAFDFSVLEEAWFGVLVVGGIAFGIYFAIIKSLAKRVAAIILVSRGDRTFYQIHTNEGYKELISEGYNIERINLKKNALQELLAEAKKS
jgi:uncharacterized membrane protein (DUF485 family)